MNPFLKHIVVGMFISVVCGADWASAQQALPASGSVSEQQSRLAAMRSRGPDASLTILPIQLPGTRAGDAIRTRVGEVVGMILEQQGLKNIELGQGDFDSGDTNSTEQVVLSLGEFVRKNPITTEYALYAEYHGDAAKHEFDGLRAMVVDKTGSVVWTDRVTKQDEVFKKVEDPDPMGYSVLLSERLGPQLGLNEETAKNAKPGKMARLMDERSGMPPENERTPLPERQKVMKKLGHKATLIVFPARIGGKAVDDASAAHLAKMINDAGLCTAEPAKQPLLLKASQADPNELKALWGLAVEFRDYARNNPAAADYVLYADYVFTPQHWQAGFVHSVVCDRKGEWVIVDLQNSTHPDYQSVKPTSQEGCDALLVKRLSSYLMRDPVFVPESISVAGTFNTWNITANHLSRTSDGVWQGDLALANGTSAEFKFVGNNTWDVNWGESNQTDFTLPLSGTAERGHFSNICVSNISNGIYRFRLNDQTGAYTVEATTKE